MNLDFMRLKNNISSFFINNKRKILNTFLSIVLFVLIVLNSGYTLTYLNADTFFRTLVSLISFIILGFIFAFVVDFSKIVERFKAKKPTWCFIAIVIFGFSTILTMFCSKELDSFLSYANFGIQVLSAYLIAKLFNLKKFVSVYQKGLFIICVIALIFYIVHIFFGVNFYLPKTVSAPRGGVYFNYFYLAFQCISDKRMQGPFWEPGLFASFLLIGMAFEIEFYKRPRWVYLAVFFICLLLTKSTFGYILFLFIILFLVNKKTNNIWICGLFYFLIFGSIMLLFTLSKYIVVPLAEAFPNVFGKMVKSDGSIMLVDYDRFSSPLTSLQIWLKSPVWGVGMQRASAMFGEMLPGRAQTSTTTFYLSQFGIFGIAFTFFFFFGLWKNKTICAENRIIFTMLFLAIFNKEPHAGIIFEWILMFLFLKEYCDKDHVALAFDPPSENSIIASFKKHDDASILKRNIGVSFVIKGIALVIGFFSYPIYRKYFNNDSAFGVWLTVLSLMAMIISFDLGLGNGLKNNMVKAIAQNDKPLQKKLISSTYISSACISLLALLVLTPIIFASNLNSFFNIDSSIINPQTLKLSTFFVCLSICLELCLKNVNSLLQAKQKQALSSVFALVSTVALMTFALIYKNSDLNNLLLSISIVYICTINIPLICGTIFVFFKDYKGCSPSIKFVTRDTLKSVATLGLGFFAIQIMLLVINSTNEIIISNIFGSASVVSYTNYYKPFSIIAQLFTILTLPYWAIITKEKEEHNTSEIKKNIKKLALSLAVFVGFCAVLSLLFQPFVNLWLGADAMPVNYLIVLLFDAFIIEWMSLSMLTVLTNGLSIVKEQVILFIVAVVIKLSGCFVVKAFSAKLDWYYILLCTIVAYVPLLVGEVIIMLKSLKKMDIGCKEEIHE